MAAEDKSIWQHQVATAIVDPASMSAADKLTLLTEWPILRAWAKAALKRDADRVPASTINAYLRDALAWSGHLGDPSEILAAPIGTSEAESAKDGKVTTPLLQDNGSLANDTSNRQQVSVSCADGTDGTDGTDIHPRPIHFDQYRDLMPDEVQQQFDSEIVDAYLLRDELASKRDSLAELVEQAMYAGDEQAEDEASSALSVVAQQVVAVDSTIRHFWAMVDVAFRYYQLNGEIMPIEDLRAETPAPVQERKRAPRTPDYTKAEIDAMFAALDETAGDYADKLKEAEAQKTERIRKNSQFLRDKRKADNARANGGEAYEKWREQIVLRAAEMEAWGVSLTAVQREIVGIASPDTSAANEP